jgi:ABC-type lipoprotein release transport system permease subunit
LLLIIAIGIAGGAALTALAGARRTHSAVDRFVSFAHPASSGVAADPALYDRIARLPHVVATSRTARFGMLRLDRAGRPIAHDTFGELAFSNAGITRPILLAGRLPRADRADEIAINSTAARNDRLRVGDVVRFAGFAPDQLPDLLEGTDAAPRGPTVAVHVVGIARLLTDLSTAQPTPDVSYTGNDGAFFSRAFLDTYADRIAIAGGMFLIVRLDSLNASDAFAADVDRLSGGKAFVFNDSDDLNAARQARHATDVEALALLLFGILAAVITLTLISQSFGRQVYLDAHEYRTLAAMGTTRVQLVASAAIRAAVISVFGAALAVVVAIVASPYMPIGLARQAEVDPGVSVDPVVFIAGVVIIAATLTSWTAWVCWRSTRHLGTIASREAAEGRRPSRIARFVSRAGSPPSATIGAGMAFETGGGAGALPVRTAFASAVLAVAVVAGVLTFGANLSRLATHPDIQGWTWDVAVGNPHSDDVAATAIPTLMRNPDVAAVSAVGGNDAEPGTVNGHTALLISVDSVAGHALVPYSAGRQPRGINEIALGTKTLRDLHVALGDHVRVSAGAAPQSMLVTGRVLLTPRIANDSIALGQAAVLSGAGLKALNPDAVVNVFLVRFHPNVDRAAARRRLQRDFPGTVLGATRPADIENLQRVNHIPALLAGLFALIALLVVGNMLVSSVRLRRRELAVLRSIGFVRRQVSATVIWQATLIALVAIAVGVPLGAAAGRATWTLVTDRLGLEPNAVYPLGILAVLAGTTLLAANAIAIVPGVIATRTPPAQILRTE